MDPITIQNSRDFKLTINRLCYQLIENHDRFENSVLIGLQPRGIYLVNRLKREIEKISNLTDLQCGFLDITFYRDDFRRREYDIIPSATEIDFEVEGKRVILVDDVLYTGRTIRSGLDALLAFGRPAKVELMVFIDRRFSRHLPIQPDYIGTAVDTIQEERVEVKWEETDGEDCVKLFRPQ